MSEVEIELCLQCRWIGPFSRDLWNSAQGHYACPECSGELATSPHEVTQLLIAERKARQEAEAQAAAYREVLVTLDNRSRMIPEAGGADLPDDLWRLVHNAVTTPPADAGKPMLAIVEAARRYVEADKAFKKSVGGA